MPNSLDRPLITHMSRIDVGLNTSFTLTIWGKNFHPSSVPHIEKHNDFSLNPSPTINSFTILSPTEIVLSITTTPFAYDTAIWVTTGPVETDSRDWSDDVGTSYLRVTASPGPLSGGHVGLLKQGKHEIHYPTITSALADSVSGDVVRPSVGTFVENIVIPAGVTVAGCGSLIQSETPGGVTVVLGEGSGLKNIKVQTPSIAGSIGIQFSGATGAELKNCSIVDGGSIGVVNDGSGTLGVDTLYFNSGVVETLVKCSSGKIRLTTLGSGGTLTRAGILVEGTGHVEANDVSIVLSGPSTVLSGIEMTGGELSLSDVRVQGATNGIYISSNNIDFEARTMTLNCTTDLLVSGGLTGIGAKFSMSNCITSKHKWSTPGGWLSNAEGLTDVNDITPFGERAKGLEGEFHLGAIGNGAEICTGEGDSVVKDMIVATESSVGVILDVSEEAQSPEGSPVTFADNAVGSRIWFSISTEINNAGDHYQFEGIKAIINTVATLGLGSFKFYKRDGAATTQLRFSVAASDHTRLWGAQPFTDHAPDLVQDEHIRFQPDISDSWAESDPIGLGSYYWVYVEIVDAALTTLPVFEKFKIHTNHAETEKDGFGKTLYAKARSYAMFHWDMGLVEGATTLDYGAAGIKDVYLSETLGLGRQGNELDNVGNEAFGLNAIIPFDTDTSDTVKLIIKYLNETTGGNQVLNCFWGWSYDGDGIFGNSGDGPIAGPNQQSTSFVIPAVNEDIQNSIMFELNISDLQVRRSSDIQDMPVIWVMVARPATDNPLDSNGGAFWVAQIAGVYTQLSNGGHR